MKDDVKRIRRQATDAEKISAEDTDDKGLLPKIYQELLKFNIISEQPNFLNGQKANRRLTTEGVQTANEHMERPSTSCVIRKLQIKALKYPTRMRRARNLKHRRHQVSTRMWCKRNHIRRGWDCRTTQPLWRTVWQVLTKLNRLFSCDPGIAHPGISPTAFETS